MLPNASIVCRNQPRRPCARQNNDGPPGRTARYGRLRVADLVPSQPLCPAHDLPEIVEDAREDQQEVLAFAGFRRIESDAFDVLLAYLGVRCGTQVAEFANVKDPQYVVIDEVSGVHLALILGLAPLMFPDIISHSSSGVVFGLYAGMSLLNWKYLLAGFVLFRLFDILKPFPCRRLENLPGGWGIMADDWMAGVYAAICLRLALHFYVL